MPYAHNSGGNKTQEETESAARVDGGSEGVSAQRKLEKYSGLTGWFSALWGESARTTLTTISRSDAAFNTIKNIGAGARYIGYSGIAISTYINISRVANNPTWGNYGRLTVSSISIGASVLFPGPGTIAGLGITALDATGNLNGFYNYLDFNQQLYNENNSLYIPFRIFPVYSPVPNLINIE
jgi:hypothetical protein